MNSFHTACYEGRVQQIPDFLNESWKNLNQFKIKLGSVLSVQKIGNDY
jgi:hypothetical protein